MRTPERLSALGYGAANLGNLHRALSDEEATAILEAAWDCGIRHFDTAPHYGLGLSERRLGAFLRDKPRDEYTLSTKVGRLLRPNPGSAGETDVANDFHVSATLRREWDFTEAGIRASLAESLDRMGLDRVDVLYLHDPERHDLEAALNQAIPALEQLRAEGEVGGIGVGSMSSAALTAAVQASRLDVVMVAGRYTLLEQPAEVDVFPACRARGTKVVAASIFNSGILAKDEPDPSDRYEYGALPPGVWDRLQRIRRVCREFGVSLPAAAVQFPLRNALVESVVVGASRPEQLQRSVELMTSEIPQGFWDALSFVAPA
jgi:D-threo-aldose 1-dehydrogenase